MNREMTLYNIADDIGAYWESREMVAAQLTAGVPDALASGDAPNGR